MPPGERVDLIQRVAQELVSRPWTDADLILNEFGLPTTDEWDGDYRPYVVAMLQQGRDDQLVAVHDYLFPDPLEVAHRDVGEGPWQENHLRLFISHVHAHRAAVATLQQALESWGIDGFVAHNDIAPSAEWRDVIDTALMTCDVLVAYLTLDFHHSEWTDQEVGYAMARRRLVIPVRVDVNPYGLMGKYQALACPADRDPVELARLIADMLWRHPPTRPHMAAGRVERFAGSNSFNQARANWERVREIPPELWTDQMKDRLRNGAASNSQISGADYNYQSLPQLVRRLLDELEAEI
ncbi:MAG: hypothetical protein QOJ13_954 [Gaiellales bacterium]|nr:hypothetical protein [Gaiellales bacterium]